MDIPTPAPAPPGDEPAKAAASHPFWSRIKGAIHIKAGKGELVDHTRLPRESPRPGCPDFIWDFPESLGRGYFRTNVLSSGITITVSDYRLTRSMETRVKIDGKFIMAFALSGWFQNLIPCQERPLTLFTGTNCLYGCPPSGITRKAPGDEHLRTVVITIPFERFRDFKEMGNMGAAPELARALADGQAADPNPDQTTPQMHRLLIQILTCPFQGMARLCFLEAKVMELIAHKLNRVTRNRPGLALPELEKIHNAREIIIRQIQDPPSLQDLAGLVGLTHTALNRGFKAVFGATVFEYLRCQRLQYSQVLISEGKMSLTQIAHAVGFGSSSYFSRSFTKHYGIRPSQFKTDN